MFATKGPSSAMGYFGIWLWATLASAVAAAAVWIVASHRGNPLPRSVHYVGVGLACAATLGAIGFFLFTA
jgi:hypothetical protein